MEPPVTWLKRGRGSLSHLKPTAKSSRHKERKNQRISLTQAEGYQFQTFFITLFTIVHAKKSRPTPPPRLKS
jgi:hypothetical protein